MEITIWKFELGITYTALEMPVNAEILTVQTQKETPYLWALVDPNESKETRTFVVYGTGHPISYDMGSNRIYIGTYQLQGGSLIFHVFEYTGL